MKKRIIASSNEKNGRAGNDEKKESENEKRHLLARYVKKKIARSRNRLRYTLVTMVAIDIR